MNKKKFGLLVTVFFMLIIVIAFFVLKEDKIITNDSKATDIMMTVKEGSLVDWTNHFDDLDSMESAADLIIKGEKVDSYPEQRCDLIFTKEIIDIEKIYKGDLTIDDKIELLQTGGTFNDITTPQVEGAPILEENHTYLLFLQYTCEGHYLILGGYQGVALLKGDEVIFSDTNFALKKDFKDKKYKDIKDMLKNE